MPCTLTQEQIDQTTRFHGHWCPGLAIGLRAGEWALREMGRAGDEEIATLVETDMCAVDAVQFLTGCTFGKGNLIHLDYGKPAFSFFRRRDGKSARLVFEPGDLLKEVEAKAAQAGTDQERAALKEERARLIMEADLERLFRIKEAGPMPRKARILTTLRCEACGEPAMESRTHRFQGRTLCRPCFRAEDGQGLC